MSLSEDATRSRPWNNISDIAITYTRPIRSAVLTANDTSAAQINDAARIWSCHGDDATAPGPEAGRPAI